MEVYLKPSVFITQILKIMVYYPKDGYSYQTPENL
jgi:hypothetical protein